MTRLSGRVRAVVVAVLALAAVWAVSALGGDINPPLPTITLQVGNASIECEVAVTTEQRRLGLMNRPSMPADHGMIFVYEKPRAVAFWMKNTRIPLSAAFIAADGTIVKIEDMQPQTEDHHGPDVNVQYVLELNQGRFKTAGARVGDRIDLTALRGH